MTESAFEQRMRTAQARFSMPIGAREILLVRHGSTFGDHVDTLLVDDMTVANPPITPDGEAQAEAVAERLQHEPISAIFVTPLQRTHQTAAPLIRATGIEPHVIPDLREVFLGDFEHDFHRRATAGDPLLKEMIAKERWDVIPNSEPMAEFGARVRRGMEAVIEAVDVDRTAVAIVHGGVISEVCRQATESRMMAFMAPENGSITRIVIQSDGRWLLRSFNDVAHLAVAGLPTKS